MTTDSVDGAALRKRHIERLKSDTSPVTVLTGQGPKDLGQRICEAVVPKRPPATPVLVKPNLCGYDSVKDPAKSGGDDGVTGRTTSAEFTRGVVQCLKARGHTNITIADGCGHTHKYFDELMKLDGYEAMAKEEGVKLVAMDDDGVFDVEGDKPGKPIAVTGLGATHVPTLLLPKILAEALDHGLFLSLPKAKAHRFAVFSMAIKGMQGTVMYSDRTPAYQQKWRSHKELKEYLDTKKDGNEDRPLYISSLRIFGERMVDVLELSTPDAVLVDGAPGEGGDGFQKLVPTKEMVAIGGTNPVLVDRVGAEFLGLWNNATLARELGGHRTSPLLEIAAKRYKLDITKPILEGDGAALFNQKRPVHFKAMAPFTIDEDPAPGTPPAAATSVFAPPSIAPSPAAPTPAPTAKPEAHAVSLGTDTITPDGKGTSPAWARAKAVAWDTDFSGKSVKIPTKARFVWSPKALYALFEIENTDLNTDQSKPITEERKSLYQEDCVELFFTPDLASPKHYFEIELGPFGHFFDLEIDRETNKNNIAWSSNPKIAAHQDKASRKATIEVELSSPDIVRALKQGARLPIGLYRMEGKPDRSYLAWSPPRTAKPNFHVPEAFGFLVLD
jgi:uncharacterized protein (DUF362 family)